MTSPFINENLALLPLIRQALVAQDAQWLTTMTRAGLLDAPARTLEDHASGPVKEVPADESLDRWRAACMGVVDFLDQIKPERRIYPCEADIHLMDVDVEGVAGFKCGNPFKEWFAEVSIRVLGQGGASLLPASTLGRWAMAACVLDLPETLRVIATACPQALEAVVEHHTLGAFLHEDAAMSGYKMQVNAMYLALQLSRVDCMKVIQEVSGRSDFVLGERMKTGSFSKLFHPFDLADNLSTPSFGPVCNQQALVHALRSLLIQEEKAPVVHAAALKSMTPDTAWNMQQYIPAFIEAGAYEGVASKAAETACAQGFVSVLQSVKGCIHWDEVRAGMLYETLELCSRANNIDTSEAAHVFLAMAIEEGHGDKFAHLEIKTDQVNNTKREPRLEPLSEAIRKNAFGVVHALLEFNGISPSEPMAPGLPSAIALADEHFGELATKLRTMSLRQLAMALIDCMDADPPKGKPLRPDPT